MYRQTAQELQEEKGLLVLLNQGNQYAFEKLYRSYSVRILKKLIRLLKDEEVAKELLQDVFLKIWEKREHIDSEGSFRSYLFRIAENQVMDFFRKAANDRKLVDYLISVSTELYNGTEEAIDYNESNAALQKAIESLPPQRQKIFVLCKIEGKSYEEVAEMLGVTAGTVNDHMVKAMRTLRKHFIVDGLTITTLVSLVIENLKR